MTTCWWQETDVALYDNLYKENEERKDYMNRKAKIIGIFFGAYKNKPTKHFIKYLNKVYSYVVEQRGRFEVIYVSMDEEESDCEFFIKALMGDWLILPWDSQELRENLKSMYNVKTLPALVVVKNDLRGSIVRLDGKSDLLDYGYFCWKEWLVEAKAIPEVTLEEMMAEVKKDEEEEETEHEDEEKDEDDETEDDAKADEDNDEDEDGNLDALDPDTAPFTESAEAGGENETTETKQAGDEGTDVEEEEASTASNW